MVKTSNFVEDSLGFFLFADAEQPSGRLWHEHRADRDNNADGKGDVVKVSPLFGDVPEVEALEQRRHRIQKLAESAENDLFGFLHELRSS